MKALKRSNQKAKWIHHNNVCVKRNSIRKNKNDSKWDSSASSLQFLEPGSSGSIEFHVPKAYTQQFFIGFSSGCINPDYNENIVGVHLQHHFHLTDMIMSIRVMQGGVNQYPTTNQTPIDTLVSLLIEDYNYTIRWGGTEVTGTINSFNRMNPIVAKICLFNKNKVVKNVKLLGDWKTHSDCSTPHF